MSSIETLSFFYLSTGFAVGFGHCIGMCGPIVVSLSLSRKDKSLWIPHLLYNAGRVTTYAVLGAIMGATGSFTAITANIAGIQKIVLIFAGILIVIMGLAMSDWLPLGRLFGDGYRFGRLISGGFQRLTRIESTIAYLPLGLLLGLLPCGPVYTALLAATRAGMETGSPTAGALIGMTLMGAFGIGTIPALLAVSRLAGIGWLKSRQLIYRIGAVLMIIVGLYFIVNAWRY
ncbi:MAG: hypothetical protein AMJ54_05520 [Deltaproteobacteria bacterium SG8_13]|nr:MAG: hypothetical protein AMJ54_05520 [Deltaproteobacteria bacterium SG8_13]